MQLLLDQANSKPDDACVALVNIVESLKQRIMFTRHQEVLRSLQLQFGGDIVRMGMCKEIWSC